MSAPIEGRMALPSRVSTAVFSGKAAALRFKRHLINLSANLPNLSANDDSRFTKVIAESRSSLYGDVSNAEAGLQMGKVQNLRVAAKALNNLFIPAGAVFSFWKAIGKATKSKGYVPGRQLQEGCLFPAIGGGLCQLSNALYSVALDGGCEILERHGHSAIVPGSMAELGRDATVAWNYVDLRFRPRVDTVLKVALTEKELVVRLLVRLEAQSKKPLLQPISAYKDSRRATISAEQHSCVSCGQGECSRHAAAQSFAEVTGKTAYLVDEKWPEFLAYIVESARGADELAIPLDGNRWRQQQYAWPTTKFSKIHTATFATLVRSYRSRKLAKYGALRLQEQLAASSRLAATYGASLGYDVTHVVATQSLVPFLWKDGVLGGRTFDVLLMRLPLKLLHERLDEEARLHPERNTLTEYRAPLDIVKAEWEAIASASSVITPHSELAQLFGDRAVKLDWELPKPQAFTPGSAILFAGPTAARKGAYELREAAKELDLEIVLAGSELEGADFWDGVRTRPLAYAEGKPVLDGIGMAVQPALVEERPRLLLRCAASGIPVLATKACGLEGIAGVTEITNADCKDAIVSSGYGCTKTKM